ncbi:hypothetical protein CYMTET_21474 [Cymbomonas tetramitiformis]|uniref:Uncharacterized protein n=1 Tax=Cymbomonas tetramitiformis TaxID=36881 RepID=A0AAE0G231_9CHLO|nr:hypothetical protein CYMTET_21474 [Cymbomonas tetramitiformis]
MAYKNEDGEVVVKYNMDSIDAKRLPEEGLKVLNSMPENLPDFVEPQAFSEEGLEKLENLLAAVLLSWENASDAPSTEAFNSAEILLSWNIAAGEAKGCISSLVHVDSPNGLEWLAVGIHGRRCDKMIKPVIFVAKFY